MKLAKNQLTLFDLFGNEFFNSDPDPDPDPDLYDINLFDTSFNIGSKFLSGSSILEITDLCYGSKMCWVKNITLENQKKYVNSRYCLNKESTLIYYFPI